MAFSLKLSQLVVFGFTCLSKPQVIPVYINLKLQLFKKKAHVWSLAFSPHCTYCHVSEAMDVANLSPQGMAYLAGW